MFDPNPDKPDNRVRLTGAIRIAGEPVEAGTELELGKAAAHDLVRRGKAVFLELTGAPAGDSPEASSSTGEPGTD